MRKLICCVMVWSFFFSQSAIADDRDTVEKLIQSKLDGVISILQRTDISLEEKNKLIDETVSPMFDFKRMAMLTLGKKYWSGLTEEQKKTFTDLFVKRMKDSYRGKLALYTDERVIYERAVQKKNKIRLQTYLISKDRKFSILYKLYPPKGQWKIYDLEIEGTSVIRVYRTDYKQLLQNGTFDDLLLEIKKPVDS